MTSYHTLRGYGDRRQELYTLEALWEEARKAKEYHCEALYLDPGWDTGFGSAIWDEERLRPHGGGYEPRLSLYSKLVPEAGQMIADTSGELLNAFTPGQAPPVPQVKTRPIPWEAGASKPETV